MNRSHVVGSRQSQTSHALLLTLPLDDRSHGRSLLDSVMLGDRSHGRTLLDSVICLVVQRMFSHLILFFVLIFMLGSLVIFYRGGAVIPPHVT